MSDQDIYLRNATAIADHLADIAIHHRDSCNWLTREIHYNAAGKDLEAHPGLETLNPSLYSGTAGVALMLARLHRHTGDKRHARTALAAINHAIRNAWINLPGKITAQPIGSTWRFGYYLGTMGIVWAAHEVGEALGSDHHRREAKRLLGELAETRNEGYELDLMFGVGGAIPALVDLAQKGVEPANELARALGQGVLDRSVKDKRGVSWKATSRTTTPGVNLLGLSHGVAGIATSLAVLYEHTGEEAYREAALGGFEYERAFYSEADENWPHFGIETNPDGSPRFFTSWCHGAPGVGISRAIAYPILKDRAVLDDLRLARRRTAREVEAAMREVGRDVQYCHGLYGNGEALWLMDEASGEPNALGYAQALGKYGIERYGLEARERWGEAVQWPTAAAEGVHPPLMTGVSGAAYFLLRLHDRRLPTMLFPAAPARP